MKDCKALKENGFWEDEDNESLWYHIREPKTDYEIRRGCEEVFAEVGARIWILNIENVQFVPHCMDFIRRWLEDNDYIQTPCVAGPENQPAPTPIAPDTPVGISGAMRPSPAH